MAGEAVTPCAGADSPPEPSTGEQEGQHSLLLAIHKVTVACLSQKAKGSRKESKELLQP